MGGFITLTPCVPRYAFNCSTYIPQYTSLTSTTTESVSKEKGKKDKERFEF